MLYLKTLGGLWLAGPQGPVLGSDAQRRRLALLALVAEAGEKGMSRDRVLALLWPESDDERARHALNQTIYAIRKDLGADLIVGTRDLRVDAASLTSDIQEFREALQRGDVAFADELYQGPFLDGIHIDGAAPEFEDWIERTRPRLNQALAGGLERAAQDRAQAGDWKSAIRLWRRIVSLDPLSGPRALGLAEVLVVSGDRTGALQALERHQELIRTSLGAAADSSVRRMTEELRERVSTALPSPIGQPPSAPPPLRSTDAAPHAEQGPSAPPPSSAPTRSARRRMPIAAGSLALAAAAAAFFLWPRAPLTDRDSVLIAEFRNATGDSLLDAGLGLAFTAALKQSVRVRIPTAAELQATLTRMGRRDSVIDEALAVELAQRDGIELVIAGAVTAVDSTYDIVVRCVDPVTSRDLRVRRERATGRAQLLPALDRLARGVRDDLGESIQTVGQAIPLPQVTTPSLEALRLYADGNRAASAERLDQARTLWEQAIGLDSGFALAHAALGGYWYRNNQRPQGDLHFARALAETDRLGMGERLLLEARIQSWRRNWPAAIAARLAYLQGHPSDWGVRSALGYNYMMANLPREALASYDTVRHLGRLDQGDFINMGQVYKQLGQWDSAYGAYQEAFRLAPELETTFYHNHEFGSMAVQLSRLDDARAIFEKMLSRTPNDRARGLRSLAYLDLSIGHYDAAERKLREAAFISESEQQPTSEARNRLLLAAAMHDEGDGTGARAELARVLALFRRGYLEPRILLWAGKPLARRGDVKPAALLLDSLRARAGDANDGDQSDLLQLTAEIALARGDPVTALQSLERAFARDSSEYLREALAFTLARAGRLDEAAEQYRVLAGSRLFGSEAQQYVKLAPYWLARVEERRGESAAAARWYKRFVDQWATADSTLPPLRDARRRLAELSRLTEPAAR